MTTSRLAERNNSGLLVRAAWANRRRQQEAAERPASPRPPPRRSRASRATARSRPACAGRARRAQLALSRVQCGDHGENGWISGDKRRGHHIGERIERYRRRGAVAQTHPVHQSIRPRDLGESHATLDLVVCSRGTNAEAAPTEHRVIQTRLTPASFFPSAQQVREAERAFYEVHGTSLDILVPQVVGRSQRCRERLQLSLGPDRRLLS